MSSAKSTPVPFTENSWKQVRNAGNIRNDIWQTKYGELWAKDTPIGTYHKECYRRYTNTEHLERIKNRWQSPRKRAFEMEQGTSVHSDSAGSSMPTEPKRSRRSLLTPGLKEKEERCFACREKVKYLPDKKNQEKLLKVETKDVADNIVDAAEVRNDERVKLDLAGRDPIAIEIQYHRSCYANYINPKTLDRIKGKGPDSAKVPSSVLYQNATDHVLNVIAVNVLEKNEIVKVSFLRDEYVKFLNDRGVKKASCDIRVLKPKIRKQYGDSIDFAKSGPKKPEYVFNAGVSVKELMESLLSKIDTDEEEVYEKDDDESAQTDQEPATIYNCGVLGHTLIQDMQTTMPWPPSPTDISQDKIVVPDLLYNLLAYIITGHARPVSEGRAPVNSDVERLVLSVAQDLINITSKGKIKTVKSVGLGIAVKNLTGNKEVQQLLNRFGHALSYDMILKYEKELMKKIHGQNENTLVLPSNVLQRVFSTFIWDNNDLCEETLSGAGTTHVTNGILVQQGVSRYNLRIECVCICV